MKLNIANPSTGLQKLIEFEDEKKLHIFMDKRISDDIEVDTLGEEFKGYVFRITGGMDKQGFPMMQGLLCNDRRRVLVSKNHIGFKPKRNGQRRRKSIRGCIVAQDLSVLNLVVVKQGENALPGLTDSTMPQRRGPKRASKIRKLFELTKEDDLRKWVVVYQHTITPKPKEGEEAPKPRKYPKTKNVKIQRLVTPTTIQRRKRRANIKKRKLEKAQAEAAAYAKLLAQRRKDQREKRAQVISKKRASLKKE